MGFFNSKKLTEKAADFKRFLHSQNINIRRWAAREDFSENAAYAYQDTQRSDIHLPAFMIETLPIEVAKNVVCLLRQKIITQELMVGKSRATDTTILKQFINVQKEFQDYCRHIILAIEDGEISAEELDKYNVIWMAFYVAQVRLFGLMEGMQQKDEDLEELL